MAQEIWDIDVVVEESSTNFPETGSVNVMYVVEATVDDVIQYSFNYWNGSSYSSFSVGPKPHPHH